MTANDDFVDLCSQVSVTIADGETMSFVVTSWGNGETFPWWLNFDCDGDCPQGQTDLALSSNIIDFGNQLVGTSSAGQSVTVENIGAVDLTVSALSAPSAPFAADGGTCGTAPFTLAPTESCTLTYTFSPMATGAAEDTVTLTSNASSSPDTFDLAGNGVQPGLSLDTTALSFNALPGELDTATVTVSNDGNADLEIDGIASLAAPFSFDGGSCFPIPATLLPGAECTINVTFAPGAAGTFNDAFDITSDATSSPDTVTVQGNSQQLIAVPALGRFGLLLMALALMIAGGWIVSRRRA